MSYDRQIYEKVENYLYELRLKSIEDLERKKIWFYKRFPRAKEIEKSLKSISILAARAVLKGENVKQALENIKIQSKKLKQEYASIVKMAGYDNNHFKLKYSCDKCKDEGFLDGKMCSCICDIWYHHL